MSKPKEKNKSNKTLSIEIISHANIKNNRKSDINSKILEDNFYSSESPSTMRILIEKRHKKNVSNFSSINLNVNGSDKTDDIQIKIENKSSSKMKKIGTFDTNKPKERELSSLAKVSTKEEFIAVVDKTEAVEAFALETDRTQQQKEDISNNKAELNSLSTLKRRDVYGNAIFKGARGHRVSFADFLKKQKKPLVEFVDIPNISSMNISEPKNETTRCKCLIF